ncbi:GNAT family N-acetyltransferase [Clostridium polynesiense]|uniref:GNAT family N-acetyltransferase n=1 Tax=Clostridium polynesiense TaxID=1325933 RepID=UPI00058D24AB|nr:GNAT family N-acetyltransferase [Clostridium polynesiense]
MKKVKIREAKKTDFQDIADLSKQLGYEVSVDDVNYRYNCINSNPDSTLLVAENENRVVAWIQGDIENKSDKYKFGLVSGLVVDKDHRQRGIGTELLTVVEDWCFRKGCLGVRINSGSRRKEAHKLYEKLGYINKKTYNSFYKELNDNINSKN